jgi:hypothetical protein
MANRTELSRLTLTGEGRAATPEGLRLALDFLIDQINRNFQKIADTPSSGGVSPSTMFAIQAAGDFALGTGTSLQTCFGTANDVWTLAASTTYLVEGLYYIGKSGTACTVGIGFTAAGGLSTTLIGIRATGHSAAVNATSTTTGGTFFTAFGGVAVAPSEATAAFIQFSGLIQVNAGGTLTPGIIFSAAPTSPLMKAGSFITFTPIGSNTVTICGNVA